MIKYDFLCFRMFLFVIVLVFVICFYVIYMKIKKVFKVKINGKVVLIIGCDIGSNLLYSLRERV